MFKIIPEDHCFMFFKLTCTLSLSVFTFEFKKTSNTNGGLVKHIITKKKKKNP